MSMLEGQSGQQLVASQFIREVSSSMTKLLPSNVVSSLSEIVGSEHVITDPDRLLVYESDGLTAYRRSPRAVVLPSSTAELSAVIRLLHKNGVEVIPRGAGTGLSGGALTTPEGVIVGTARMNRILKIDVENRLSLIHISSPRD